MGNLTPQQKIEQLSARAATCAEVAYGIHLQLMENLELSNEERWKLQLTMHKTRVLQAEAEVEKCQLRKWLREQHLKQLM